MSSIAIITARGGSKRIPKKNIKDFCGKPIIAYSIETAIKSDIYHEIMVSTDSEEIAEIAVKYGAKVPFLRSKATSNDYATSADVIKEVLCEYVKKGKVYDIFTCIYPTDPFVTEKKLEYANEALKKMDIDGVVAITRFSFPPQRAFVIRNDCLAYQYPENARKRSQDLEPLYYDAGQFYFCKTERFLEHHSLILPKTIGYIMKEEEVQDIDTLSDWTIAEMKYKIMMMRKE